MEHLGLAISFCSASLLVWNLPHQLRLNQETRTGALDRLKPDQRQRDEPGAGSLGSLSLEAEVLHLLKWVPRVKLQAGSLLLQWEKSRRVYVCGTEECSGPRSEERKRGSFAAKRIRALFQHSETYMLLYICHMALLCSSTCVVAAQCWVKRAPKSRSVVGREVVLGGTGQMDGGTWGLGRKKIMLIFWQPEKRCAPDWLHARAGDPLPVLIKDAREYLALIFFPWFCYCQCVPWWCCL